MSELPATDPDPVATQPSSSNLPVFLMLLSSIAASLSLGMVSYTFATGALPFGVKPLIQTPAPAAQEDAGPPSDEPVQRPAEHYAWRLYEAMDRKRTELEHTESRLADERRTVEELIRSAELRETELRRMEEKISGLLDRVDQTEVANLKQLGDVLGEADGKAAADMLLAMDQNLAARVLYFMDERTSGELLSAIQKSGEAAKEKAVHILEKLQRIAEEPAP